MDYKQQVFKKGDVIIEEGDKPHCAYILSSGQVEVTKKRNDGEQAVLTVLKAGDIFGEMSLVDSQPRSATVTALEDVRLIIVDATTFKEKQLALDAFSRKLVQTLIQRLRHQNQILADITEPSSLKKSADKGKLSDKRASHTNVLFQEDYREKINFGNIRFLLGDPNPQARQGIKGGLHMQGFREIDDVNSATDFATRVAASNYDLILMDSGMGIDVVASTIDKIRHGKTATSPYAVIFGVVDQPDPKTLEALANAGLDDVLVKPIALGNIIDRVEKRVKARKAFVVTMDYVGPDRRVSLRPGAEQIPLVDVPNPLSFKALPNQDARAYSDKVEKANTRIEMLKIERHAVQIDWLREKIGKMHQARQSPAFFIKKMVEVTHALMALLEKREDEAHGDFCLKILSSLDDFEAGMKEMAGQDWADFTQQTQTLRDALGPRPQAVSI